MLLAQLALVAALMLSRPQVTGHAAALGDATARAFVDSDAAPLLPFGPLVGETIAANSNRALEWGRIYRVDPSAGSLRVALPPVARGDVGRAIVILNATTSATAYTIAAATGETIDGSASISVAIARSARCLLAVAPATWTALVLR